MSLLQRIARHPERALAGIGLVAAAAVALTACQQLGLGSNDSADKPKVALLAKEKPELAGPAVDATAPVNMEGLHNVVAYSDGLYSGSVPEKGGMETLSKMGVKTIVSVDGAAPDVADAKAHGLKYVHLPIGYNGMDEARTLEIAKAISMADGPVYVHCHHGKHRSAAATGAAAVTLGLITNAEAEARMKVSGTAANYTGLYECVATAMPVSAKQLKAMKGNFPEINKPSGLVQTMVEIDEAHYQLGLIEKAGWKAPADHPDLVPVAVAGQLADYFRVLHEEKLLDNKAPENAAVLAKDQADVEAIEAGLSGKKVDAKALSERYARVTQSCKDCHTRYRDVAPKGSGRSV